MVSTQVVGWDSGAANAGTQVVGIAYVSAGVIELNNGTKGTPAAAPGITIPNSGSGAGSPFTITGSSAFAGSGLNGGSIYVAPGAKDGAGTVGFFGVTAAGGTPGTTDVQIFHDGTDGRIQV